MSLSIRWSRLKLCVHVFQSPVLVLEFFQLLQLRGVHTAVFASLVIEAWSFVSLTARPCNLRSIADTVLAADIFYCLACLNFLQDLDNLRLAESRSVA